MNYLFLSHKEVTTKSDPTASVIFLHGFGEKIDRYVELANQFEFPNEVGVRFVIPQAPLRESSLKPGKEMHAWMDWINVEKRIPMRETIDQSACEIEKFIVRENERGIETHRIFIVGFSQGGSMSLHTALRYRESLGGVVVMSSYCPTLDSLSTERSAANDEIPMFLAQGVYDKVIKPEMGMQARDVLLELGYQASWNEYDIGHKICADEIQDLSRWITELVT